MRFVNTAGLVRVALLALVAALLWWRGYVRLPPTNKIEAMRDVHGSLETVDWAEEVSVVHYKRLRKAMATFLDLYQKSFRKADCTLALLKQMVKYRDRVLRNLTEIKMRMPNDTTRAEELQVSTTRLVEMMTVYLEDVRERGMLPAQTLGVSSTEYFWSKAYDLS